MPSESRKRLLIFIVAYNAEKTIQSVLSRIPAGLGDTYDVEILAIDDASRDRTFEEGYRVKLAGSLPFSLHVLFNPENQGYGGNQKIGYHYAIENGFDFVALIHGDGQYAPEALPGLLEPLREGSADAVFGSRMMARGAALKGGMPLYKYVGNKILTGFENRMLRSSLSEFHSGYRIYSVAALKKVPFDRNTNDFHFDTEIIVQFVVAGLRIRELPIPTYYGDEICHVKGLKYAWDVLKAVLKARAQELGIFYDPRFDCAPAGTGNAQYQIKLGYDSPHTAALERVPQGARVLDLGCAGGYMGEVLRRERGCHVTGVDMFPLGLGVELDRFIEHNLDAGPPPVAFEDYDCVLMLDVIEHLAAPEAFVDALREAMKRADHARLIVSTGNVGFVVVRLMLLIGQFNYGKRGILDLTHKRLFTFASLRRLFEEAGFEVLESRGIPAPFPLALGDGALGRALVAVNAVLLRLLRGPFAYQIFMVLEPRPTLERLLERALHESAARAEALGAPECSAQRVA
jgi:glycosyltransferase involved in cell wall biosynthesis/2-polyprenyl-3-methyl-5-hydroxy-6-metoxy-1,4-benzoquinol methylase